jgi:hypothetical protein
MKRLMNASEKTDGVHGAGMKGGLMHSRWHDESERAIDNSREFLCMAIFPIKPVREW